MGMYTVNRSNVALSTTNDLLTILPASGRAIKLHEVSVEGMGTSSAANELDVQVSTGGSTGGGGITPQPNNDKSAAAASTVNTTWTTQPTLSGIPLARLGVNSNGGVYRKVWKPGTEPVINATNQVSLRSAVGTGNVTVDVIFEEL